MNYPDPSKLLPSDQDDWLVDGGKMGALIRSIDWSRTPLGPRESWPQGLRTTLSLCLGSTFPIAIIWGPQRIQLYNDGYVPIAGGKHPHSMGQDFRECWTSGWPVIGEPFGRAVAGKTAFLERIQVFVDRNGYLEEAFFTASFSPLRDDRGQVVGIFHPTVETTQQILGERRMQVLRHLANATAAARTVDQAVTLAVETLANHGADLPFLLIYLLEPDGKAARLAGTAGLSPNSAASPERIGLEMASNAAWPLAQVRRSGHAEQVERLAERFGPISCGPYPESVQSALVMPIAPSGLDLPLGFLIAGVSTRRALDEPYQAFYELLSAGITTALGNARAYELERQRAEALAEIDRAKTAFFSNVSHEFRTPLTLMVGPLEEVLRDPAQNLPESHHYLLETVHRNALRLLKLVNTLLDFSRIEAGRIDASYSPTDLSSFTAELASVFRAAIEAAGLKLVVDCPPLPEPVFVDRDMWEKIVLNLLSNAFKFTLQGRIEVKLRWSEGKAVLTVADTGVGVPPEHLPRLFERFHRVPNAGGRTYEGSGIGLALVHELVKLHGGTISADSQPGRGTVFTVAVPGGKAHLPADRIKAHSSPESAATSAAVFLEEALHWSPEAPPAEVSPPAGDLPSASTPADPARILLADDNADMREYVRRLLAPHWEVEAVADGLQALEAVRRQVPDLVLTDVMMPNLDGFGLLKALRADVRTRNTPIIMLSARAGEEARVEGVEAGADDYLVKPFGARELLARVRTHLALAAERRQFADTLARMNDELEQRVAERTAELSRTNDALLQSNLELEHFTHATAHDLQTPLRSIAGFARLMQGKVEGCGDGELEQWASLVIDNAKRLQTLIANLLTYARIEAQEAPFEPVQLPAVVSEVVASLDTLIRQTGTEIQYGPLPTVPAGRLQIAQVLQNLIENGIKYNDSKPPKVSIACEFQEDQWVCSVTDNGIGILPKYHDRIFQIFSRLHSYHRIPGTGIGLALCRRIVERHGGRIWLESRPGEGSTFYFSLPARSDDAQ